MLAAEDGHEATTKPFRKSSANTKARDRHSIKTLTYVAKNGHKAIVRLLLSLA